MLTGLFYCIFTVSIIEMFSSILTVVILLSLLSRVYQFSKRHALEEFRQQVALSQGVRARLEVQRVLLKEKLDQLGPKEPPSALNEDQDAASLLSAVGSVLVSEGGLRGDQNVGQGQITQHLWKPKQQSFDKGMI